jgi:hypothetical protein
MSLDSPKHQSKVEDMYSKNNGQNKGSLNPSQVKSLKHLIKDSPTIENKLKKKYGYK